MATGRLRALIDRVCVTGSESRTVDRLEALLGLSAPRRDESAFVNDVRSGSRADRGARDRTSGHVAVRRRAHSSTADVGPDRAHRRARTEQPRPGAGRRRGADGTHRRPPHLGGRAVNQVCMRLEPLPDADAAELVRQAGGSRLDESIVRRSSARGRQPLLHRRIDGHVAARGRRPRRRTTDPSDGPGHDRGTAG